jgi:hypothetical protein
VVYLTSIYVLTGPGCRETIERSTRPKEAHLINRAKR